jgi:hypothetical protein
MTNQAKFDDEGYPIKEKAMRKGNTIKDLTSSNVMLVKPSQDCQAIGCCCCCTKFDLWKNILEILDGDEDCFDFGRYTTAPSRKDMVILRSLIIKRLNKR